MLNKLFDSGRKELKRCSKIADKVLALENEVAKLSDDDLKNKTVEFKERVKKGESLDDILVEAYAVCREAAYRVSGMKAYRVQIIGAIAIHGGNIAEMKTGEGKTLTAVFPAYLNSLSGEGVHIVTVNEYLAQREVIGEIGEIYRYLGLTIGLNLRDMTREEKQEAYKCDILYSTNSELGFDYLRDHMVNYKNQMVQRPLNYAIIDEVDSILIDEARTPLIISGGAQDKSMGYIQADTFAKNLKEEDYEIDIETKTIVLKESGITKAEKFFGVDNIYDIKYVSLVHHINNALKANYIFTNGVEYVVQNGEVNIVDSFTGRILKGRQYSEGLHQAIEAKENVEIKKETVTVATITYQNFFRMYKKLSGMTGTAKTEEEEFRDIYNMYVVEVPTNRPVIREDRPDLLFTTKEHKFNALVKEIKRRHELGQPILVGTADVTTSELVSSMLTKLGLKHEVLNAKNNTREAEIVALAGQKGAITISTNMAGRGTDIKLGEGVKELGGLCVFGTERHESRRIDNQLRGRSGRQGDPGFSQFYISAEDDLIVRFAGDKFKERLQWIVSTIAGDETQPIENKMLTKQITGAQTRIEGNNFDSRKNVLKYDDVIRVQREIFYEQRTKVICEENIEDIAFTLINNACKELIQRNIKTNLNKYVFDDQGLIDMCNKEYFGPNTVNMEELSNLNSEDSIREYLENKAKEKIDAKRDSCPPEVFSEILKAIILKVLDNNWTKHIDEMDGLRQGVALNSYAQQNPLQIYQEVGYRKFNDMLTNVALETLKLLMHVQIRANIEREDNTKNLTTNAPIDESVKHQPKVNKEKVGRNDPCPCGSGKKYKNCCGLDK